jgi:thiamine-phosphate pyrophosphorylase
MLRAEGVYAILDVDAWRARGVEVIEEGVLESIADALLATAPSALQLRAKGEGADDVLSMLRRLKPRARAASVPLVANDRLDLAVLAEVDALHVGQDDLPLTEVRRVAPSLLVGVSTHDLEQLARALEERPSYVAFGPVFGTMSKVRPDPTVGTRRLMKAQAKAAAASTPLVAIGGVSLARVPALAEAGVSWAAVIGEIVAVDGEGRPDLPEVARKARELADALAASARGIGA